MIIFALSFVVHGLSELGLTSELITATFYKQVEVSNSGSRDDDDDNRNQFKYSNMQVILLTVSCMYFLVGSTLEYTRHSGLIVFLITVALGMLKFGLGLFALIEQGTKTDDMQKDIEHLELNEWITHILVASRFALFTIFIITLAKWFTRSQLPLVFGLWFLNEGAAFVISMSIKKDEYLYLISGALMIFLSLFFKQYFCIDPIDAGFIINEQAINLTA